MMGYGSTLSRKTSQNNIRRTLERASCSNKDHSSTAKPSNSAMALTIGAQSKQHCPEFFHHMFNCCKFCWAKSDKKISSTFRLKPKAM
uniref:Uncharacterized protein n=1 Tax=Romanomermis culicivorax TaxID=13658 RepID=A0A915K5A2_ROMCU